MVIKVLNSMILKPIRVPSFVLARSELNAIKGKDLIFYIGTLE